MLPDEQMRLLTTPSTYHLTTNEAKTLATLDDGERLDYFMAVRKMTLDGMDVKSMDQLVSRPTVSKTVVNWYGFNLYPVLNLSSVS